jgi:hypothetical protein
MGGDRRDCLRTAAAMQHENGTGSRVTAAGDEQVFGKDVHDAPESTLLYKNADTVTS